MKRKPLSQKTRFEVFKRDGFSCQYCGQKPPDVVLECDHINPVKRGGKNDIDNLITACFDCNRGKGSNELTTLPESVEQKAEKIKERELQYKEYKKLLARVNKRTEREVDEVHEIYRSFFPTYKLTDVFLVNIKGFIKKLGTESTKESMEIACARMANKDDGCQRATSYFCGICWKKIKGEAW